MSHPINTINAEEEKITREGAYGFIYHYDELFNLDFDTERIVVDILSGRIQVEGWSDPLSVAESYVRDVEDKWMGEDTSKHWDLIKKQRDLFVDTALNSPLVW